MFVTRDGSRSTWGAQKHSIGVISLRKGLIVVRINPLIGKRSPWLLAPPPRRLTGAL